MFSPLLVRTLSPVTLAIIALLTCPIVNANDIANALYERGDEQSLGGDLQSAIASYQEGLALSPDDASARIRLAHLQRNAGDTAAGITTLEAGIARDATSAVLHVRLGELFEAEENPAAARKHYQRAVDLAPSSTAGVDANANLADLDTRSRVGSAEPSIEWSTGPKVRDLRLATKAPVDNTTQVQFERLDANLSGEWCLEWADRYRHQDGMCVSDAARRDLDLKAIGTEVGFTVIPRQRMVSHTGVESATGLRWPAGDVKAIERSLGNRTVIQTVLYPSQEYVEFSFGVGNESRQCMQLFVNQRGEEHRLCGNRFTFCRCER